MRKNEDHRRVLLIEPNYKNKYPPIGLMKLATYHKKRSDVVRFYKGDLRKLIVDLYAEEAISKFYQIDPSISWRYHKQNICTYIQIGRKAAYNKLFHLSNDYGTSIGDWLKYFWKAYRTGKVIELVKWDRICISTLFTFYYSITIDAINYCKKLLKTEGELLVGGIMATVIPDEIEEATGVKPISGLLNRPGMLDSDDSNIIDELPLDYSILEEIDYKYPENNAYYGCTTRGCIRKCDFCAVPKLEPIFNNFISLADKIKSTNNNFGERRNLLLLDNNVLASKKFPAIIQEIKQAGFTNGATYVEPNYLDIAIKKLKNEENPLGYRKLAFDNLQLFRKKLFGQSRQRVEQTILDCGIVKDVLPTKQQLLEIYDQIKDLYESRRSKIPKKRWVDFNQGIDARLIDEEKMALLASIPIRPLRIAFDSMEYADIYENSIRLAAKYKIRHLSNYILFNYKDDPVEFYQRLKLNIHLSEELDLQLYSFPMRYSPIWDDEKKHHGRNFVGDKWNKKFIRAVQCVLNATKGKVGRKKDFFEAAFGKSENEFFEILWMPEPYILYRKKSEELGYTNAWRTLFHSLTDDETNKMLSILELNQMQISPARLLEPKLKRLFEHYQLKKDDVISKSTKMRELVKNTYKYYHN